MVKNRVSPDRGNNFKHKRNSFFVKSKSNYRNNKTESKSSIDNSATTSQPFFLPAAKTKSANSSGSFFVRSGKNVKPSLPSDKKNMKETSAKKPFDKKKFRLQKYSKKYKLEQWEEKRKKAVLREYYKEVKDGDSKFNVQKIYEDAERDEECDGNKVENENNINMDINMEQQQNLQAAEELPTNSKTIKRKAYKKAHLEFERLKDEKKKRKEELAQKKAERDEALKLYKEKKVEKFKTLSRKTKKGQPIMKDRMEMLLAQIQKNLAN